MSHQASVDLTKYQTGTTKKMGGGITVDWKAIPKTEQQYLRHLTNNKLRISDWSAWEKLIQIEEKKMGGRGAGAPRQVGARKGVIQIGNIHLQGVGDVPAMAAGQLKAGDHILYNFGITARVEKVEKVGTNSVKITTKENGKIYYRTRRANTKIASDAVMGAKLFNAHSRKQ